MEPDLFEKKSQIISEYGKARKLFHIENNDEFLELLQISKSKLNWSAKKKVGRLNFTKEYKRNTINFHMIYSSEIALFWKRGILPILSTVSWKKYLLNPAPI